MMKVLGFFLTFCYWTESRGAVERTFKKRAAIWILGWGWSFDQ